jgi:glucokinase
MLTIGVDVGGTKVLALAADRGRPEYVGPQARRPTPRGAEAVADAIAAVVEEVRDATGEPLAGVGLGVPGLVDRSGRLRVGPNLPDVLDYPFADVLGERLGVPVAVDNDATCAAWAERERGAARGAADAVLVTLGTGIGAGVIAGGQLQRGANGFAGEPGHMVVDPNGPWCPCGRRGCWERFASGSGLGRLARDAAHAGRAARVVELAGGDPESVRGEHVTAAAKEGDEEALTVLGDFAWWVALGIANLVNLLDPSVVVVGGGLVSAGDVLLDPVRAAYHDLVLADQSRPPCAIVRAELGELAGAIGAALIAADRTP